MLEFESQAQRYAEAIEQELQEGRLNFPTALDVSLRIKRLADDANATLDQIAKVVQAEPVLSAKVVRMANSVALNPYGTPITSVTDAVRRIGLATLRCMAFAVSAEQLAQDHRSKAMRLVASGLWIHSVEVACWAYALAKKLRVVAPDTALFAGMMVDIGEFFLLARATAFPELEADMPRFAEFVSTWNEPVSRALLEALDMPEDILDAFDYEDPYGGSWPPKHLADILFVAGLATEAPNPFALIRNESRQSLLTCATLGIEPEALAALIESVKEERQKILAAVCGQ
jgi:HD-like signal output (HDOD) protein